MIGGDVNLQFLDGRRRPHLATQFKQICQASEWAAANRLTRPDDRLGYMAAHWSLRQSMAKVCKMAPDALRFSQDRFGKPHLLEEGPAFSISHSGPWALTGMANKAIGVDIEILEPDRAKAVPIGPMDGAALDALQKGSPDRARLALWCLKEAAAKCHGSMDPVALVAEPLGRNWFCLTQPLQILSFMAFLLPLPGKLVGALAMRECPDKILLNGRSLSQTQMTPAMQRRGKART